MLSVRCTCACEKWHHIRSPPHLFCYSRERLARLTVNLSYSSFPLASLHKNNENMPQPRDANLDFHTFHCLLCSHTLLLQDWNGLSLTFLPLWWHSCVFTVHFGCKSWMVHIRWKLKHAIFWCNDVFCRYLKSLLALTSKVWLTHFIHSTKG